MNRSALVIKMLQILAGRKKPINRYELAQMLESNPRNVLEFKKEIETAGYMIDSTRGKYGGYVLNEQVLFPSLQLSKEEYEAIENSVNYLSLQKEFIHYPMFEQAMMKLQARNKQVDNSKDTVYFSSQNSGMSDSVKKMVDTIYQAKNNMQCISFAYTSLQSEHVKQKVVHPYEVLVNKSGVYLLGYDVSDPQSYLFKHFKIIENRMSEVRILSKTFARDYDFKVSEHVGKSSLMKERIEVEIRVTGVQAKLLDENITEYVLYKHYENGQLHIRFLYEGRAQLLSFLMSLQSECEVIAPIDIREELQNELVKMMQVYTKKGA